VKFTFILNEEKSRGQQLEHSEIALLICCLACALTLRYIRVANTNATPKGGRLDLILGLLLSCKHRSSFGIQRRSFQAAEASDPSCFTHEAKQRET